MNYEFNGPQCSSDESGKGDFFGGLHVCVFLLDQKAYKFLESNGLLSRIRDSKAMSNSAVIELGNFLVNQLPKNFSLYAMKVQEYNKMYAKFKNLNHLLSYAHNYAWNQLVKTNPLSGVMTVMDQFTTKELHYESLKKHKQTPYEIEIFETKAESTYLSCALASIIARFSFIKEIEEISRTTCVKMPFGNAYGTSNCVLETFKTLEDKKLDAKSFCKQHFKTLQKTKGGDISEDIEA